MSPIFVTILIVNEVNLLELIVEITESKEEYFLKALLNLKKG